MDIGLSGDVFVDVGDGGGGDGVVSVGSGLGGIGAGPVGVSSSGVVGSVELLLGVSHLRGVAQVVLAGAGSDKSENDLGGKRSTSTIL